MGRPTSFTQEIADEICNRLSEGESLRSICLDDHIPNKTTVNRWLLSKDTTFDPFRTQYAQAREIQAQGYQDEILDIADDSVNDWVEREAKSGRIYKDVDRECVQRSSIRIEARKWILARMDKRGNESGVENTAAPTLIFKRGKDRPSAKEQKASKKKTGT